MIAEANAAANPAVTGAIRQAAKATGTSFQYLLATAQVESNFNPSAAVKTSSARGLFQFIEQTWLTTLKEQGAALGYGRYANAIEKTASGQYAVTDPRLENAILNLRADPTANAVMAGAYTRTNAAKLEAALGRKPSEGELYLAHFLGASGASRLIGLASEAPRTRAAEIFPSAARANPSIFFNDRGQMRNASDVYRMLIGRYDSARGPGGPTTPAAPATAVAAAGRPLPTARRPVFAPDTAGLTQAYAAAAQISEAQTKAEVGPVFHGLFRTSPGREAVAPVVSALWSAPVSPAPEPVSVRSADARPTVIPEPAAERSDSTLGLFQDQVPDARALFRGRV